MPNRGARSAKTAWRISRETFGAQCGRYLRLFQRGSSVWRVHSGRALFWLPSALLQDHRLHCRLCPRRYAAALYSAFFVATIFDGRGDLHFSCVHRMGQGPRRPRASLLA